jgi:DNA-binding transcriptional LysR family regulator
MLCGQVTRAAEWLHTSQPTISRELARLEQVLAYALFERVNGRMRPTARALALMEEVEASYVGLDRIAAHAAALAQYGQGRLQLACLPALAQALVPQAVAGFARHAPEASVSLVPLESPLLEAALSEQRHDLGLGEQPAPPACHSRLLLATQEVCVLPTGHPLAAKAVLAPPDFAGLPFVSLAPNDPYRQRMDQVFAEAGVQRRLQVESGSAASVCALVQAGVGVALVNPLTALSLAHTGLVLRPFAVPIAFQVHLSWPQWRAEHPLRPALVEALVAAAAQVQGRLEAVMGAATPGQGGR